MLKPPSALPSFGPRSFHVARALWFLLLGSVVLITLAGATVYIRDLSAHTSVARLGIYLISRTVDVRPISPAAQEAGLMQGADVVEINGVAVPPDAPWRTVARRLRTPDGGVVALKTRTPSGELRSHRLVAGAGHIRSATVFGLAPGQRGVALVIASLVGSSMLLGAALLLFQRRARDPVAFLASTTFLLAIGTMLPAGHALGEWSGSDIPFAALQAITAGLFLLLLFTFPDGRFAPRWARWWGPLSGTVVFAIVLVDSLASTRHGILVVYALLGSGIYAQVARFRGEAEPAQRQQLKWSMFGFAAGVAVLCASVVSRLLLDPLGLDPVEPVRVAVVFLARIAFSLGGVLIPLGLMVALLRFKLWDADAVIGRSASAAVLTLMLGGVWAGSQELIERVLEGLFGGSAGAASAGLAAAVAALVVAPAHRRVNDWAERRFQPAVFRLRQQLPPLLEDLRDEAPPQQLAEAVLERVGQGVRSTHAAFLVRRDGGLEPLATRGVDAETVRGWLAAWTPTGETALRRALDDRVFPLRLALSCEKGGRAEVLGWIVLGPRPDGSPHGRDEVDALVEAARPIARALSTVQARAARQAQVDARIGALERAFHSAQDDGRPRLRSGSPAPG